MWTTKKFVEHKQQLSKFCHLFDINVSSFDDSTHVKTIISLVPCMPTDSQASRIHRNFEGGGVDSLLDISPQK
jgi:hypothetical protein